MRDQISVKNQKKNKKKLMKLQYMCADSMHLDGIFEGRYTFFDCLVEEEGDLEKLQSIDFDAGYGKNPFVEGKTIRGGLDLITRRCSMPRGINRDWLNVFIDQITEVNPYLGLVLESYCYDDQFPTKVEKFKKSLEKKLSKRIRQIENDLSYAEYELEQEVERLEKSFKEEV
ncbi:hypothetical protein OA165_00085 [Prochlorococcus sp. AH-736-A21]|nr:hypothetical protein [Prochlorococcus sp. AH-736-A21]